VSNSREPAIVRIKISVMDSLTIYPSGEMDVAFCALADDGGAEVLKTIRFSSLAASQLFDAIHDAIEAGHIRVGKRGGQPFH
jgi:hypothetical protein